MMAACGAVCRAGLLPFAIGSETWGSIVCPATTVGVSSYRPTGGTIPNNGLLQVITQLASSADLWTLGWQCLYEPRCGRLLF